MPVINESSEAYNENYLTSWQAELQNAKILLFEVNKGINTIITSGHSSYSLSSGQSSQSVQRLSLPALQTLRTELISQIDDLEKLLGIRKKTLQIVPGY